MIRSPVKCLWACILLLGCEPWHRSQFCGDTETEIPLADACARFEVAFWQSCQQVPFDCHDYQGINCGDDICLIMCSATVAECEYQIMSAKDCQMARTACNVDVTGAVGPPPACFPPTSR